MPNLAKLPWLSMTLMLRQWPMSTGATLWRPFAPPYIAKQPEFEKILMSTPSCQTLASCTSKLHFPNELTTPIGGCRS